MKRLLMGLVAVGLLGAAAALSGQTNVPLEFLFTREARNPITHLRLNNDPAEFQFAIVSDRTGGHRPRIFSRAVEQLNLLQPEFVVSVGDLIEGYTDNAERLAQEWREFQTYVSRLQMPFFYVPGNHDLSNVAMEKRWQETFGRRYYDFVYRNVLFLILSSEDPPGQNGGSISEAQREFVRKALDSHPSVRWTLVFLHKPMWVTGDPEKNGWSGVEELLHGRPCTVFAGHVHRYQKFLRDGHTYYQLATTGGGSRLRGAEYGEFDHFVWVTMKKDGPVLANLLLDGIYPEDLKTFETAEEGAPDYHRRPTFAAQGKVLLHGQPVAGAYVVLQSQTKDPRPPRADALTAADGTFVLSTYAANDGAPAGEYTVSITQRKPLYTPDGRPGPNHLPERFARAETSGLKASIKSGTNELVFELQP